MNDSSFENLSSVFSCPEASDEELEQLGILHFILEGVVQCLISCLGVAGNTISIFLLLGRKLKNSFNQLLAVLAIFDLIYICTMMLDSIINLGLENDLLIMLKPYFLHPLNSISMMCSIYMTIGVAMERYTAVYHPMEYNRRQQDTTSKTHYIITFLSPLIILAILFNIPKFFESEVKHYQEGNTTKLYWDVTDFRMNDMYVTWYINWARLLILGLIPFISIFFLNTKIYLAIRRRRRGKRRRDDNLSIVLMLIVGVFLICNLPRLILNMHEITVIHIVNKCTHTDLGGFPAWSIALGFVSHVLLVLNSSINLMIYCLVGAKFRQVFWTVILCRNKERQCQCMQNTEDSKCPKCGQKLVGLKTIHRSGGEEGKDMEGKKSEQTGFFCTSAAQCFHICLGLDDLVGGLIFS